MEKSKTLLLLLLLALCWAASPIGAFRKQQVIVSGRLFCGTQPYVGTLVKLIEEDTGLDPDDNLAQGKTNSNGYFRLSGSTRELSSIEAFLKIYHNCNDYGRPCDRKWRIRIPNKYINSGEFNLGDVNLEVKIDGETRNCV